MGEEKTSTEMKVGERIRELRETKDLSLREMADLTGFSTALLSQMENHLISPSLGTLIKISFLRRGPRGTLYHSEEG
jgi:transcriptional regulator with XRE-family HTH domain